MELIILLLLGYVASDIWRRRNKELAKQKWDTDEYLRSFDSPVTKKNRLREVLRAASLDISPDEMHTMVDEIAKETANGKIL